MTHLPAIAWLLASAATWYALGALGNVVLLRAEPILREHPFPERHSLACAGPINLAAALLTLRNRRIEDRRRRDRAAIIARSFDMEA